MSAGCGGRGRRGCGVPCQWRGLQGIRHGSQSGFAERPARSFGKITPPSKVTFFMKPSPTCTSFEIFSRLFAAFNAGQFGVVADKKGIQVLGTGDLRIPAWLTTLKSELVEDRPDFSN